MRPGEYALLYPVLIVAAGSGLLESAPNGVGAPIELMKIVSLKLGPKLVPVLLESFHVVLVR